MFKKIYVPVDNSEHSNQAIELAIEIAQRFGATLVGSHVYAARLHDYRFKQAARVRRLSVITEEFVVPLIQETVGEG